MNSLLQTLLPYVLTYKYLAIFVITYLGAVLLPLPSGSLIMASCAFATQGYLNFYAVITVGIVGNIAGDHSGYWLARAYGKPLLKKIGFRKSLESEGFAGIEAQIDEHPMWSIFLSRFLTAVAPTVNIIAGLGKMSYARFSLFEVSGEITEVLLYGGIGYLVGTEWIYVDQLLGKFWILIVASMLLSLLLWKKIIKRSTDKIKRSE